MPPFFTISQSFDEFRGNRMVGPRILPSDELTIHNHVGPKIDSAGRYLSASRFCCQRGCTRCCTQEGWVYLSVEDVPRLAVFLGMSASKFQSQCVYYTKYTLRLRRRQGNSPFLRGMAVTSIPSSPRSAEYFRFGPN
jgi:hypothetical protein